MNNKELKKIAKEITILEQKCQNGENISENLVLMEELVSKLSIEDLLELSLLMETNFP
jgi:hypothetical protein